MELRFNKCPQLQVLLIYFVKIIDRIRILEYTSRWSKKTAEEEGEEKARNEWEKEGEERMGEK